MNVLISYASMTGNDEEIKDILLQNLQDKEIDVTVKELSMTVTDDIKDADISIIVTYTYDDGEVPEPALDLYEDLQDVQLSGKLFGVCGSGDTFYDDFCEAVDNFEKRLLEAGAIEGAKNVKIELFPEDNDKANLAKFSEDLVSAFKEGM